MTKLAAMTKEDLMSKYRTEPGDVWFDYRQELLERLTRLEALEASGEPPQPRCPKCESKCMTIEYYLDGGRTLRCRAQKCDFAQFFGPSAPQPSCEGCKAQSLDAFEHDGCFVDKVVDQEQARWQKALYDLSRKHAIAPNEIDGSGCDSGDPLDLTLAEVGQVICQLENPQDYRVAPSGSAGQEPLRISFDIGGVLSKYPEVFRPMVAALQTGGAEVYVITDMHEHEKSVRFVRENGYDIPAERILNSDYTSHGEGCKAETIKQHGIHIHLDDFAGYCAHTECVSLFVWPNPSKPYYADDFKTDGTEGDFGRRKAAKI